MLMRKAIIISVMMLVNVSFAFNQSDPEVWMSMRHGIPDLVGDGKSWPFVLEHLDGLKYMRSNLFQYATPEDVKAVGALLKEHGIKAHLEVSGPSARDGDDILDVGIRSAERDIQNIGFVTEAAGEVFFLDVDWVERVRDFERYARSEKLEFNLIVNCQDGGKDSDALFSRNTLTYVDLYRNAGGRPDRYIVQSWYDHPKCIVPDTEPGSMTHLVAEIIRRVRGENL
jgi:hypothetical protein